MRMTPLTFVMAAIMGGIAFGFTAALSSCTEANSDKVIAFENKLSEYEAMYCAEGNAMKRELLIALIRTQLPSWQPLCTIGK